MREMNIDFYRVTMPKDSPTLDSIFAGIHATACDAKRNVQLNDSPVRLQEGGDSVDGFCAGDLVRIQLRGFPADSGLDGTSKRLSLGKDHGLGHETAFLYYKPWQILLLQRNRSGVSPSLFARYAEDRASLSEPIALDPVPQGSAKKRLTGFKKFRHVRVRVAAVGQVGSITAKDQSVSAILKALSQMKVPATSRPMVDMTFSVEGPRHDSLERGGVIKTVEEALGLSASKAAVEILDVSASNEIDGKLEVLHYLNFVLTDQQPITSAHRSVPYHQRASALTASFQKQKPALEELYGKIAVKK